MKLLLDFDGVINFFRKSDWPTEEFGWYQPEGFYESYPIHYSPDLVREINALHVDKIFSSTWVIAPGILDFVGLTGFSIGFKEYNRRSVRFAKQELADSLIRAGEKFIWADDDAIPSRFNGTPGALLVRPNQYTGIAQKEMQQIKDFVDQNRE